MNKESSDRTEKLAPILRGLESQTPDWKSLAIESLTYLGLEELAYCLGQKRQDWRAVFQSLKPRLEEDPAWIRCQAVLAALRPTAQELEQIAQSSGLSRATISQTINALERGGFSIPFEHLGNKEGRPRKAFYRR